MENHILFLWAIGMGDRIASIPYLLEMKLQWKKITLLEYDDKYIHRFYKKNDTLDFLKQNNLFDDLLVIPYNKFELFGFIIKNLFKYNLAFAPTKTFVISIWWHLFAKKFIYAFKNLNDNSKYDNFISWMLQNNNIDFPSYKMQLKNIPYSRNYKNKYNINWNYVTVYVWPYWWSIESKEWMKIFDYLNHSKMQIVLLWGDWEDREWWVKKHIKKYDNIISLLWMTSFEELFSIIQDAKFTISANWWIMWLSHLLNEKSISFSISSWFIIHPPVNNKTSFHIHANACPSPCEIRKNEWFYQKNWYKHCIYYWTKKCAICKKAINSECIINLIKKL